MSLADKVKNMSMINNNVTKVAGLELANRKFMAQSPDLARKAKSIALVHINGQQALEGAVETQ
jgi:hypothetical protein